MIIPRASDTPHEHHEHQEVSVLLTDRFALDGSQTVLVLGAAPAAIAAALALAPVADQVYAVAPDPAVLAEGSRRAGEHGASNISWLRGEAAAVTRLCLPRVDLCVIAEALPRADRERVLAGLDAVLGPRGGIALLTCPQDGLPEVLAKSAFSHVETVTRDQYGPAVTVTVTVATRPRR